MSRSRSRDRGFRGSRTAVDKEKLLAIAKKNAVKLLSSDNLMASRIEFASRTCRMNQ